MKLQTSDWSMAAGVRSSTMLVVTAMVVTSSSGVLAVMLARTAAVCAVSETSCYMDAGRCMDAGRYMDTHDDGVLYVVYTWLASQSRSAVILRPHPLKSAGSHSAVLSPPTHLRTTIPPETLASP